MTATPTIDASADVAVLVGSLRKESYTRRIVLALAALARPALTLSIVEIANLEMYNPDLEAAPPASWIAFRNRIARADAVVFATPEYNRSMTSAIKNAIDVGSRPRPENVFRGVPAGVISVSQGMLAGFGANHHLRQSLVAVDMPTLAQPEIYLGNVASLLADDGGFSREDTRALMSKFVAAFTVWIQQNPRPSR